jgi:hypothetical protein
MSTLTNLTASAKADLAKLGAEAQTYVTGLEDKVASVKPYLIGGGAGFFTGVVVHALVIGKLL